MISKDSKKACKATRERTWCKLRHAKSVGWIRVGRVFCSILRSFLYPNDISKQCKTKKQRWHDQICMLEKKNKHCPFLIFSSIDIRSPPQLLLPKAIVYDCAGLALHNFGDGKEDTTHIDLELCSVHCTHPHALTFHFLPLIEFLPRVPHNTLTPQKPMLLRIPMSCIADTSVFVSTKDTCSICCSFLYTWYSSAILVHKILKGHNFP